MGYIETHTHVIPTAEIDNRVGINEQVVELLPTKMPGERRHRLGNHLDAAHIQATKTVFKPIVQLTEALALQVPLGREAADVGDDAWPLGTLEIRRQLPSQINHPLHLANRTF